MAKFSIEEVKALALTCGDINSLTLEGYTLSTDPSIAGYIPFIGSGDIYVNCGAPTEPPMNKKQTQNKYKPEEDE